MKLPVSIINVLQVKAAARYDFALDNGFYRGRVEVTTNAGVELIREELGDGPERSMAFALEKIARDILALHPRPAGDRA